MSKRKCTVSSAAPQESEKIIRCCIRIEVADWSTTDPDIDYTAPDFKMASEKALEKTEYSVDELDEMRGCRQFGDITIETLRPETEGASSPRPAVSEISGFSYAAIVAGKPNSSKSFDSQHSHEALVQEIDELSRPSSSSSRLTSTVEFKCGNPSVEQVQGILHLFKDSTKIPLNESANRSELICMLAVPNSLTLQDLIYFTEQVYQGIEYMKVIRDHSPSHYMTLIKFRTQKEADEFYINYNNTPYNSLEKHICSLVYIAQVDFIKSSAGGAVPIPGLVELPNCPVCLERMDESVDGILTIQCNHAFHLDCLSKWSDTSCPVCRYSQTPEQQDEHYCFECKATESLWICLICGQVGCGRYMDGHAYGHFARTQHTYAMRLSNGRVWDYVGDNYVHRLVQNKEDGKLVEMDEHGERVSDEKIDSITLEYTYLLQNQLDSQRRYFEERMSEMERKQADRIHELEEVLAKQQITEVEKTSSNLQKDKIQAEKKCTQLSIKLKDVLHQLQEEQALNKSLLNNQSEWAIKTERLEREKTTLNKELKEKEEQLQDILFHLEAQNKLSKYEGADRKEVEEGQLSVGQKPILTRRTKRK